MQPAPLAMGSGLLDLSREYPYLCPLAYSLPAVYQLVQTVNGLKEDASTFTRCCEEVEVVLCGCKDLSTKQEAAKAITDVMNEAAAYLIALQGSDWSANATSMDVDFPTLKKRLVNKLDIINPISYTQYY